MANPDETVSVKILDTHFDLVTTAFISETEWQRINYVDYIPVESDGRPTAEMYEAHGTVAAEAMKGVAARALSINALGILGRAEDHVTAMTYNRELQDNWITEDVWRETSQIFIEATARIMNHYAGS